MSEEIITVPEIKEEFLAVQDHICNFLSKATGERFHEDLWDYEKGSGGGRTRVWEGGKVLEKAGVNFSFIEGSSLPQSAAEKFEIPPNSKFIATGVSLVIHPRNPHIPTIHLNIRFFQAEDKWWFGGGVDLTPYYPRYRDVIDFHKKLKEFCERYGENYEEHKKACDEYFYLKHRGECRGVGGLFCDHMQQDRKKHFLFCKDLGYLFTELYEPFITQYKNTTFIQQERDFQLFRRSRYVEFNLLWDRGTKFGVQSNGRIESILMSMPSLAVWKYSYKPKEGTFEALVMDFFSQPQDWVNMDPAECPEDYKSPMRQCWQDRLTDLGDRIHWLLVGVALGVAVQRIASK